MPPKDSTMYKGRKRRRLVLISVSGVVLALAAGLVLRALNSEIVFFKSPTDIAQQGFTPGVKIRIGGLVKAASLTRAGDLATFTITDNANDIIASYRGILPDLFREGQGVVVDGTMNPDGTFTADTVLAKHDENYMPREVADALKEQGVWEGGGADQ